MPEDSHAQLVIRLAAIAPHRPALDRICRGAVEFLDVSGAAVIVMSDEEAGAVVAAFGARVADVEDLQFALGEGPCLEAFSGGLAVLEPELLNRPHHQWPEFTRQALAFGARAVFVLPMHLGAIRVGVFYVYRDRPGMLTTSQLREALDLAELAMFTVLELQSHAATGELGPGLSGDWTHRAAVHQATGLVSAQLGIKLTEALARIRGHAFANQRSIYDVAATIVSGHLRLER